LPSAFGERLVDDAFDAIGETGGRFLHQDYRTGDWNLMTTDEIREYIRLHMWLGYGSLLASLKDSFDLLVDDYRFGLLRQTALSRASLAYLMDFESKLFGPSNEVAEASSQLPLAIQLLRPVRLTSTTKTVNTPMTGMSNERWTSFPEVETPEIKMFTEVLYRVKQFELLPASIVGYSKKRDTYKLALYGDTTYQYGSIRTGVMRDEFFKAKPPVEGDRVAATYKNGDEWFPGTLTRVRASGRAAVQYDDGDFDGLVKFSNYFPLKEFEREFENQPEQQRFDDDDEEDFDEEYDEEFGEES